MYEIIFINEKLQKKVLKYPFAFFLKYWFDVTSCDINASHFYILGIFLLWSDHNYSSYAFYAVSPFSENCNFAVPFLCAALCSVAQLCPTLCDPMHWSPPGCCVHGIFQARILVWLAIPYSRGSSQCRDWSLVSLVSPALAGRFFTTGKSIHFLLGFLYVCGFPVLWYIMLLLDFLLMSTLLFLWLKSYDPLVFGSS